MQNIDLDFNNNETIMMEEEQMIFLNNLTDELLKENIYTQINNYNYFESNINYIELFNNRYNFLIEKFNDTPDLLSQLKTLKHDFYYKIYFALSEKFKFQLNSFNEENFYIYTSALYDFFVLNYSENIIEFLTDYILSNKKNLISNFDLKNKKMESESYKKLLKNKSDVIILSNIISIIRLICTQDFSTDDLIDILYENDPDEYSFNIINELVNNGTLVFDKEFQNKFFDIIINERDGYSNFINEIKFRLISEMPKKEKEE